MGISPALLQAIAQTLSKSAGSSSTAAAVGNEDDTTTMCSSGQDGGGGGDEGQQDLIGVDYCPTTATLKHCSVVPTSAKQIIAIRVGTLLVLLYL